MSTIGLVLVAFVAAFFFVMGAFALARPAQVLAYFGVPELGRDGRNEVRAVYGGFGIAMGLLMLSTISITGVRTGVYLTLGIALLGMAIGRLISAMLDGSPGFVPWLFAGVEVVLCGVLFYLLQAVI